MSTIAVNLLFLLPGEVGGSETYTRRTLAEMARLHPEHRYVLFTNAENHASFEHLAAERPCVELRPLRVRARLRLRRLVAEQVALPRLLRRLRPDVLWNPGNLAPFFAPRPVATTIHDMQYRSFPEDYSPVELVAMRLFTALAIRRSDRILTVSEFSKAEILRFFPATPPDRIRVTPEAAESSENYQDSCKTLGERASHLFRTGKMPVPQPNDDGNQEATFLLCVANTYPHKHVEDAVAAFARVAPEFPALRLRLVGRPRRGEPAVAASIAALPAPLRERVERVHRLSDDELARTYRAAAAVVLPSRYEGFGLPALEALAAGAPVIACRAAATPEVVGNAARLFPPGDIDAFADAIRATLRLPPEARAATIATGLARAAEFSWSRTAETTLAALLNLPSPVSP